MEYLVSGWLWWPLLLIFFLAMIYLAAPLIAWTLGGIALLGLFAQFADVSWPAKLVVWMIYLAPMIVLGIPILRCRLLGEPVYRLYRSSMPAISPTEQAALDAGTIWWDAELFSGRPHWRRLLKAKPASLDDEEIDFLNGPVEELCALINDYDVNIGSRDLPKEAWDLLKKSGFFGMVIPRQYGGKGFSQYGHAAVVMKVASRSIAGALTIMIPNSVGPGKLLLKYGTEEQKNHYLPRLASGEDIPCFALTAPEAGSDAGSIPDNGIVCKQDYQGKKDALGIRLNFDKRYISLAPVATLIGVAFKLYDPDQLLGDQENLGITVALIPADTPGVEIGSRHDPLHMGFHNGPVRGSDLFVPLDTIIGGVAQAGNGWRMLMESLSDGRAISLPALTTASAKLATRATGAYARLRYQFKTYIGTFEGIQAALARI
ncbi:MAG: acyl-CoA dehydrogenase family protein, partial [Gammaproteobacteria bacterium]|nr:acyl-CoA dehydrogenase family protein [Gammaproteobacteria bacterium]